MDSVNVNKLSGSCLEWGICRGLPPNQMFDDQKHQTQEYMFTVSQLRPCGTSPNALVDWQTRGALFSSFSRGTLTLAEQSSDDLWGGGGEPLAPSPKLCASIIHMITTKGNQT